MSKDTTVAARLACGAAVDVALALAAKQATHGAALVRPPGHHVRPQLSPFRSIRGREAKRSPKQPASALGRERDRIWRILDELV